MNMKTRVEKTILITLGVICIALFIAYMFFNQEWARLPWAVLLMVICLFNLWTYLRSSKNKDE